MGKRIRIRKRLSGGRRRAIKLKWQNRTIVERPIHSETVEVESVGKVVGRGSMGEEGAMERKRGRSSSREKRDRSRSRKVRDRCKERRDPSRSRDRKDRSRSRERKDRSGSRERRREEKSRKRSISRERGGGKEEEACKEVRGREQEPGEIGVKGSQQV